MKQKHYPTTHNENVTSQLSSPRRLSDGHVARVTCHESGSAGSSLPDIFGDDGREPAGSDVSGGRPKAAVPDVSPRPPALHAGPGRLLLDVLAARPRHQTQFAHPLRSPSDISRPLARV